MFGWMTTAVQTLRYSNRLQFGVTRNAQELLFGSLWGKQQDGFITSVFSCSWHKDQWHIYVVKIAFAFWQALSVKEWMYANARTAAIWGRTYLNKPAATGWATFCQGQTAALLATCRRIADLMTGRKFATKRHSKPSAANNARSSIPICKDHMQLHIMLLLARSLINGLHDVSGNAGFSFNFECNRLL